MRKYAKPIVLILIAALLGGVYFYATKKQGKATTDPNAPSSNSIKIYEIDASKITEVTIERQDGKYVFQKSGDKYSMVSPTDFVADTSKISSIFSSLNSVYADKVVEENASNTSQYGFDKPVKVSVKYDGGVKELEIGDMNSTKDSYYVREKGSTKIYTIGTYTIDAINVPKNDLRDKTLFTVKPEDITGLSVSKGGNLVFTSSKSGDQWKLTAPIDANADANSMTTISTAISQISTYVSFIEDKPADLDKYGLKNPAYSVEFVTASGKKTLLLGNDYKKGTEVYAKLADAPQVFTINPEPLNFLDKPLKEIIEVFAYIVNIQDVSKVVVDMDGKSTISEISTDGTDSTKDKFTVDGRNANIEDDKSNNLFKKYYQGMIGIAMSDIDTNYKPAGKPEITITYTLKKDPGTMKVEFIPRDANYYYVVRNGKYANIIVDKRDFDKDGGLRPTYKALVDAMNKK